MANMTIRGLDNSLKARLRIRAAQHGHSMEEEVRNILRAALGPEKDNPRTLVQSIRARMAPLGGVELRIAPREPIREVRGLKE